MLAGCVTGPEPELVAVVVPPPVYATSLPPAGLDEAWWRGFGDPALNDLVARGLAANLDIDAATDRLDAAAALLAAERSDRLPTLDAKPAPPRQPPGLHLWLPLQAVPGPRTPVLQ